MHSVSTRSATRSASTSRWATALLVMGLAIGSTAAPSAVSIAHAQTELEVATTRASISEEFGRLASGIEQTLRTDDIGAAERLYTIEVRTARLLEQTGRTAFSIPAAREQALNDTRALLSRVLRLQERVQQHTVAKLDVVLPGEPAQDAWSRAGHDLYRPLFREGTPDPSRPAEPRDAVMNRMFEQFRAGGGTDADFSYLGPRSFGRLGSSELAEWTQFGSSRVRITTSGAKHPVIGLGRSVRGAGSMRAYRTAEGELLAVVVSNSSGNYKPGAGATEGVVSQLVSMGVRESHIIVTSVIPGEPALVKLLLKADGRLSREQIAARIDGLRQTAGEAVGRDVAQPPRPLIIGAPTGRVLLARPGDVATAARAIAPSIRATRRAQTGRR